MRIPLVPVFVATILALALVPIATAAPGGAVVAARGDLCQGLHATIHGYYGVVRGTQGDDVIVAEEGATVRAGAGDDLVCTDGGSVQAGRGDDTVVLQSAGTARRTGELELGRGHDVVRTVASGWVRLDLSRHRLRTDVVTFTVQNVERYVVTGSDLVDVRGSVRPDLVEGRGCRVLMHGGGGADRLSAAKAATCGPTGTELVAVLYGGPGDDLLGGTVARDALVGGGGRDTVNGGPGVDRCRGEVAHRCEH